MVEVVGRRQRREVIAAVLGPRTHWACFMHGRSLDLAKVQTASIAINFSKLVLMVC